MLCLIAGGTLQLTPVISGSVHILSTGQFKRAWHLLILKSVRALSQNIAISSAVLIRGDLRLRRVFFSSQVRGVPSCQRSLPLVTPTQQLPLQKCLSTVLVRCGVNVSCWRHISIVYVSTAAEELLFASQLDEEVIGEKSCGQKWHEFRCEDK